MDDLETLRQIVPTFAVQLLTAFVCGGLFGYQRQRAGSPAGLKTNILVCVGATTYMFTGHLIIASAGDMSSADPTRIAAQIITGIGFLGAGTILHSGTDVRGLTSAATIWFMGAIGLLIGCHYPLLGVGTTVFVLGLMWIARKVEGWTSGASDASQGVGTEPGSIPTILTYNPGTWSAALIPPNARYARAQKPARATPAKP